MFWNRKFAIIKRTPTVGMANKTAATIHPLILPARLEIAERGKQRKRIGVKQKIKRSQARERERPDVSPIREGRVGTPWKTGCTAMAGSLNPPSKMEGNKQEEKQEAARGE